MSLIESMQSCFPSRLPANCEQDMVGIEIEYENSASRSLSLENDGYWSRKPDGSLRNNGIEIVSRPLLITELDTALAVANRCVARTSLEASARCGLHIHVNMLNTRLLDFYSFAAQYALLEPTIFQEFAPQRERSAFCVPLYDQPASYRQMFKDIQASRGKRVFHEGNYITTKKYTPLYFTFATSKYSALNFGAFQRFGTVEFRQHPSTRDFVAIKRWIDFLCRLKTSAMGMSDPMDIVTAYETKGLKQLQQEVLGYTTAVCNKKQDRAEEAALFMVGFDEPESRETATIEAMLEPDILSYDGSEPEEEY